MCELVGGEDKIVDWCKDWKVGDEAPHWLDVTLTSDLS